MNTESVAEQETAGDVPLGPTHPLPPATQPWVCRFALIACIAIFLGLATSTNGLSWDTLSKFGYLPPDRVWDGAHWALVTSAFVHIDLWHLAFNAYWLWILGSRLERGIGSFLFLAFLLTSAYISSSFQLAFSGNTGIGASGVVYSIFGFMWLTRERYAEFNDVLPHRVFRLFILWLFGCVIVTYLGILKIGNAAHFSGLLFGGAVAATFFRILKPRLALATLITLTAFSIISTFWSPWSVDWLGHQAYKAHLQARHAEAIERYSQILRLEPENAGAYRNRSLVHRAMGQNSQALADWRKADEIDSSIGSTDESPDSRP